MLGVSAQLRGVFVSANAPRTIRPATPRTTTWIAAEPGYSARFARRAPPNAPNAIPKTVVITTRTHCGSGMLAFA